MIHIKVLLRVTAVWFGLYALGIIFVSFVCLVPLAFDVRLWEQEARFSYFCISAFSSFFVGLFTYGEEI